MVRGFYTAASGMLSQEKRLNAIANNMANTSTVGYKKDDLVYGTFGEHLAVRMDSYQQSPLHEQGRGVFMQVIDDKYVNFSQGSFDLTNRPFDLAIEGDGFFVIRNENDELRLTRDGQFALDDEGYLILPGHGRVQGDGGDILVAGREGGNIQLETSSFAVASDGTIYLLPNSDEDDNEATVVGTLLIGLPEEMAQLEKDPFGLFIPDEGITYLGEDDELENTAIGQGVLERSNVVSMEEMTRMMSSQRTLQSASQLVRMYDEMSDQANSRIARL